MRTLLNARLIVQVLVLSLGGMLVARADSLGGFLTGSLNVERKDVRTRLARDLLTNVNQLADLVQTPRPSDVAWVDEEEAAIRRLGNAESANARRRQFYESPEFQHVKVYRHLQEVKNSLGCAIDPATRLQREMFCWGVAAFLLGDQYVFADGVKILHRSKRLPEDTARRVDVGTLDSIELFYGIYSRGIQEHLVLPYLRGDFK